MLSDINFDKIKFICADNVPYETQPRIVNTINNKLSGCAYFTGSRNTLGAFYSKNKASSYIMYKKKNPLEITIENITKMPLKKLTTVTYAFYKVEDDKVIDDDQTKNAKIYCVDKCGIGSISLFFGSNFEHDKEYLARIFMTCILSKNSYANLSIHSRS